MRKQIWPRYHQLEAVRRATPAMSPPKGVGEPLPHPALRGKREVQLHSLAGPPASSASGQAGSDRLRLHHHRHRPHRAGQPDQRDRPPVHPGQIHGCSRGDRSADLRATPQRGQKPIIISTVQKFPFIAGRHGPGDTWNGGSPSSSTRPTPSHGGRTSAAMHAWPSATSPREEDGRGRPTRTRSTGSSSSRRMLSNASYFAFTATPKNKTLELFGEASPQADGSVKTPALPQLHDEAGHPGALHPRRASRTTPTSRATTTSIKKIQDDPEFDSRRAQRRLRHYVEGHEYRHPVQGRDHGGPLQRVHLHPPAAWEPGPGPWSSPTAWTAPSTTTREISQYIQEKGTAFPGHHRLLRGA